MSQLDFTRDDFAASRPQGARSVDDTESRPEAVESTGAEKVQALATEVSSSAEGIGPSKPSDLDDDSRATASGLGSRRDEAKFLVEERKRLAGGGRDAKKNASTSKEPSKADLKKAGVEPEKSTKGRATTRKTGKEAVEANDGVKNVTEGSEVEAATKDLDARDGDKK